MGAGLLGMIWRHLRTSKTPPSPSSQNNLHHVIISAPFGNYIQPVGTTATLGTFTLHPRPGRVGRILLTVRYYPRLKAWVNQIGLRNPGIAWLRAKVRGKRIILADKILSIHGFEADEWYQLLAQSRTLCPLAIELNMSCPNVGEINWPADLFARALETHVPVIVKLPPVNYLALAQAAYDAGVRIFHCCNTLPIPAGGLSGKPLKPVALECIRTLRAKFPRNPAAPHNIIIIGGGGITTPQDIDDYRAAGADHFAVGTYVMNPICLLFHRRLKPLIAQAAPPA